MRRSTSHTRPTACSCSALAAKISSCPLCSAAAAQIQSAPDQRRSPLICSHQTPPRIAGICALRLHCVGSLQPLAMGRRVGAHGQLLSRSDLQVLQPLWLLLMRLLLAFRWAVELMLTISGACVLQGSGSELFAARAVHRLLRAAQGCWSSCCCASLTQNWRGPASVSRRHHQGAPSGLASCGLPAAAPG